MGFLDNIENMAGQQLGGQNTNSNVTSSLIQELEQHSGGLAGVVQNMQQNGMADHVQNWSTGQAQATPEQAQQALPDGMIERVAARAGVSPAVAQGAIAIALPMILAHVTNNGQQAPPAQGGLGSMASQILGKFL